MDWSKVSDELFTVIMTTSSTFPKVFALTVLVDWAWKKEIKKMKKWKYEEKKRKKWRKKKEEKKKTYKLPKVNFRLSHKQVWSTVQGSHHFLIAIIKSRLAVVFDDFILFCLVLLLRWSVALHLTVSPMVRVKVAVFSSASTRRTSYSFQKGVKQGEGTG